jgi:hypothetical protein
MKLNTAAFKAEDDAPSILMGNEREWRPEGPEPEILPSDPSWAVEDQSKSNKDRQTVSK